MNSINGKRTKTNPLRALIWGGAACLLAVPWVAMQFTSEVNWDATDFVVIGLMLLVVCGIYELSTRLSGSKAYRLATAITLAGMFLLIWANLAVGFIGNEANPANLVFIVIPAVAAIGTLATRFRAAGMAYTMTATAIAQAIIALIAWLAGWGQIFVITGFFVLIWLTSAHMYRKATRQS